MDKVCELVGRLAKAPQVFVYKRNPKSGVLSVLGRYGFHHTDLTPDWHIKTIDTASSNAIAFEDTSVEPSLENHPLLQRVPRARSLLILRIPTAGSASNLIMVIINADFSAFKDHGKITALMLLAQVLGTSMSPRSAPAAETQKAVGFAETGDVKIAGSRQGSSTNVSDQSAAAFLLRTLPIRPRLLRRNNVSYIGVRTWRAALKEYQIDALRALKEQQDTDGFARIVAKEIAEEMISQLGKGFICQVVPVPGGSSARPDAFSVRIANWVAKDLGCRMVDALVGNTVAAGSSHPRKSANLHPYEVTEQLQGATLIVDDVISSGKHMELAIKALRSKGIMCFAIGWIAG